MAKGQHWQNARFEFAGCDFHDLSFFIFLQFTPFSLFSSKGAFKT